MKKFSRDWFFYSTAVILLLSVLFLLNSMESLSQQLLKNVKHDFTKYTGLEWPGNATVISVGDTRDPGSFRGGGAYHLIFATDPETVQKWLNGDPPWKGEGPQWNTAKWLEGPVADENLYNFNNFSSSSSIWHNPDYPVASLSPSQWCNPAIDESKNLLRLEKPVAEYDHPEYYEHTKIAELQSSQIMYVVKLGTIEAEGKLLAIDLNNHIVFVSLWDFVR